MRVKLFKSIENEMLEFILKLNAVYLIMLVVSDGVFLHQQIS
jgi:hypothetical protein